MSKFLQTYGHNSHNHIKVTDDHTVIDKALNDDVYYVRRSAAGQEIITRLKSI